jgi:oxygen-independent coproporphyrinogen-3 oxidase
MQNAQQTLVLDQRLIARYDQSGPRYTSYPTAVQFHEGFGEDEYRAAAQASNASGRPLSLYFHIPFCDTVCFYCACNKVATKDRTRAQPYLDRVYRELEMQGGLFDASRPVEQLHWGGGTPTFISPDQMRELMAVTGRYFRLLDDDRGEYSIEIDPREVSDATIGLLREIGFNRMSLGLQDLDPAVQQAVPHRIGQGHIKIVCSGHPGKAALNVEQVVKKGAL